MKNKLLLITLVSALGELSQIGYCQGGFDLQSYLIGSRKKKDQQQSEKTHAEKNVDLHLENIN